MKEFFSNFWDTVMTLVCNICGLILETWGIGMAVSGSLSFIGILIGIAGYYAGVSTISFVGGLLVNVGLIGLGVWVIALFFVLVIGIAMSG